MEEEGFGLHRWRWAFRINTGIAEALLAGGEDDRVFVFADKALAARGPPSR